MFKKLKDKITEEVKIPSTKFTQSMQQLAQAVVSPSSNNTSSFDHASNDNFSIGGDFDDTPQNSPIKNLPSNEGGIAYRGGVATPLGVSKDTGAAAGFTLIDLQQDSTPQKPASSTAGLGILNDAFGSLRRSSVSSSTSDSTFMLPMLESSGPTYSFQSDLESCSEASESVGPNINKEQLLQAYQKIQQRYQKYKGRYADLARHYRELERENSKAKNILAECQDKALRRISELKEQCVLEKQAKAHLEEALRSDLEEKDHLIHTLETKINLLKTSVDQSSHGEQTSMTSGVSTQGNSETSAEVSPLHSGQEDLPPVGDLLPTEPAALDVEPVLKEKVKKLEMLLLKCREDITSKCELIKNLESDKQAANVTIQALQEQLTAVQKREEEASLSLAKNKLTIHRELEAKEEENKKLQSQLTSSASRITELQEEIIQIKNDSKKDLAAGKLEATRLIQAEMQQLVTNNQNLEETLATRDSEIAAKEAVIAAKESELAQTIQQLRSCEQELIKKEEKAQQDVISLKNELSLLRESVNGSKFTSQVKDIIGSLQELRSASQNLRSHVNSIVSEAQDFSKTSLDHVVSNIDRISSQSAEELKKLHSERDSLKCDLEKATNALQDLHKKLREYEETQKEEASGVTAKVSSLEEKFAAEKKNCEEAECKLKKIQEEAEMEISSLKDQINGAKVFEEDAKKKVIMMECLLAEEQERAQHSLSGLKSELANLSQELEAEKQIKGQLENQIASLDAKNSDLLEQLQKVKAEVSALIHQKEGLAQDLAEKERSIVKLQGNLTEFESSASCVSSEKQALEQSLKLMSNELQLQRTEHEASGGKIAALEREIRDLQGQLNMSEETTAQHLDTIRKLETKLSSLENKTENLTSEQETLSLQLAEKCKANKEQEAILADFHSVNENLQKSLEEVKLEVSNKSSQLRELENLCKSQQEKLLESTNLSNMMEKVDAELRIKTEDCVKLEEHLENLKASLSEQQNLLACKTNECNNLSEQLEKLNLENSEQKSRIDTLLQDQLIQTKNLTEKVEECVKLESWLGELKSEQAKEANDLQRSQEYLNISSKLDQFATENTNLLSALKSQTSEVETLTDKLKIMEEKLSLVSKDLEEKTNEYNILAAKLDSLTADNNRLTELLQQKVSECEEKEAQLDNLADEMKRVEELSQELHRINDDRDANVEVLSSEASSLAQKVEELTVTTQQMKEREVMLINKIQVAQDLEEQYVTLKERERELTSKLKQLEDLEEQLISKSALVEELEVENKRLKEAGKNLNELVARAKEADAKCTKLQEDGANLLSRIQSAEESEVTCSILEEELVNLREENAQLLAELKLLKERPSESEKKSKTSVKAFYENSTCSKEPVIEEPCVSKHFADLTEEMPGEETITNDEKMWENKYNGLLEEHKLAMLKSAEVIGKLREENLNSNDFKSKQWLWDRQDGEMQFGEERNNTPLSIERLQQQLASTTAQLKETKKQHRQEVADLRRILLNHGSGNSHSFSRSDNLEDATELEYLRNILFEYMMGKEPMVLAKVIAAVVKFDSEQTQKVLQKEQQRLSLLGQLGIS